MEKKQTDNINKFIKFLKSDLCPKIEKVLKYDISDYEKEILIKQHMADSESLFIQKLIQSKDEIIIL